MTDDRLTHAHTRTLVYAPGDRVLIDSSDMRAPEYGVVLECNRREVYVRPAGLVGPAAPLRFSRRRGTALYGAIQERTARLLGKAVPALTPLPPGEAEVLQARLLTFALQVCDLPLDRYLQRFDLAAAMPGVELAPNPTADAARKLAAALRPFQQVARDLAAQEPA